MKIWKTEEMLLKDEIPKDVQKAYESEHNRNMKKMRQHDKAMLKDFVDRWERSNKNER